MTASDGYPTFRQGERTLADRSKSPKNPHSDLAQEAPANAETAPGTLLPRRNQGKLGLLHDWHTRWRLMSQGG